MALSLAARLQGVPALVQTLRAAPALLQLCQGSLAAVQATSSPAVASLLPWAAGGPPPPLPPAAGAAHAFTSAAAWQRQAPPSSAAAAAWRDTPRGDAAGGSGAAGAAGSAPPGADAAAAQSTDAGAAGGQNDPADCEICETVPKSLDAETAAATQAAADMAARGRGGEPRPLPVATSPGEKVRGTSLLFGWGGRGRSLLHAGQPAWPWRSTILVTHCIVGLFPQVFKADAEYVGSNVGICMHQSAQPFHSTQHSAGVQGGRRVRG